MHKHAPSRTSVRSIASRSNSQIAVDAMTTACSAEGKTRIVIVGGTHAAIREMTSRSAGRVEVRHVDGLKDLSKKRAHAVADWADVTVIWGTTPLRHSVSGHFTNDKAARLKIVIVRRGGIGALAMTVADAVTRRGEALRRELCTQTTR